MVAKQPRPPRGDFRTDKPSTNVLPLGTFLSLESFAGVRWSMLLTNPLGRVSALRFSGQNPVNLFKHAADADQVVVEDLFRRIKQLEYSFVADGVIDVRSLFARDDNIPVA